MALVIAAVNSVVAIMNLKITVISSVIVLIVIGAVFSVLKLSTSQKTTKSGASSVTASLTKTPDFSLQDYNGQAVKLSDFAGKPLIINSWAAWCPFCKKELPDFVTVQKEFGDKIVIIAINRQESLATAKGYTDAQGTSNDLIFLLDPNDSFFRSIGGFSMPETIFVDRNGNIVDHKRGPMEVDEIRERLQKIFN